MTRILAVLAVALAVTLIAVVLPTPIAADERADNTPGLRTITLQPGDNFVGWVDEPISLDDLLDQLPALERISTWDADEQLEVSATLDDRRWSGSLQSLEPGGAYVLRLGGDLPVEWTRPIVPAAGLVELRTGENWAAWLGPDDWAITDVAKGIGVFLTEIRLGEHVYDPSDPETAQDWPTVSRGDALLVTVRRGVNWLQSTYVLPELIFAGGVAQRIRNDAKRDLDAALAYHTEVFGVQADPYILVGLIPGDARSMFNELERQGRNWDLERARNWWEQAGGFGSATLMFIKAPFWESHAGERFPWGRQVLLEEYFHAVQGQIASGAGDYPPTWFIEGSAAWIRADLRERDRSGLTLSQELLRIRNRAPHAPLLEEIEERNQAWQYSMGLIAADLLVQRAGAPSMLDFFRALAPGRTGPDGKWKSQLTWQGAFAATYGMSVEEFYDEFEANMHKSRGNYPRRAQSHEARLKGTVTDVQGAPRERAWLSAIEVENGQRTPYGYALARANGEGEFTLFVNKEADYRIEVRLSDNYQCRFWWTSEGDNRAQSESDADLIEVRKGDPPPLTISVDADECRWRISGVLTGPDDEPLAGIQVQAQSDDKWTSARTEIDGSFELVTLAPGAHQLFVNLDGCQLYWAPESATTERSLAGDIEVVDQDVTDIRFAISSNPCISISGHLFDADGNGIEGVRIRAQAGDQNASGRTDASGRFEIGLSGRGDYHLYAYVDGCRVYYREDGATGAYADRSPITVSERDVSFIVFQLQDEMCALRVSGTLLNADGSAKSGVYVRAQDGPRLGGDWPDEDGSFSFTVPAAGSYKLYVTIDGCKIYYGGDEASGSEAQARALNLRRSDITNIRFVLSEGACLSITGHLREAGGDGISGVRINARADGSSAAGVTDAEGRFQIALPEAGEYRLHAWIDGCLIYHHRDGVNAEQSAHTPITVSDANVSGITIQLQPGMCTLRVSGRLLNHDGTPRSGLFVRASGESGTGGDWPSGDGAFSFTVPGEGSYQMYVWIDGCRVSFTGHGTSAGLQPAHNFDLTDSNISDIEFRLPEEPATLCS
ncbi:MAG: carboxypeptidase regulatory-like domain-containing protein [Chloroflexi bacterium]|nr:carboxypeptidase regulatory-like domain-containing protein [Chloroflexota bacterium]MYF21685.1 carboxypeptidase regulatory-like domain-containing protein [Chloroflexota bacterium]